MNLYQKLIEVRKEIDKFVKDTKGYGYSYVSGSQVLGKIRPKMDELGVWLKIETENVVWTTFDYKNSKDEDKTDFIVAGDIIYTWINADNPEEKDVNKFNFLGQQDDISKAYGSGLTYSERYFILKCLQAPTDNDDPDSKNTTGKKSNYNNQSKANQFSSQCSECGASIPKTVSDFSLSKYGRALCFNCQKKVK